MACRDRHSDVFINYYQNKHTAPSNCVYGILVLFRNHDLHKKGVKLLSSLCLKFTKQNFARIADATMACTKAAKT